MDLVKIKEIARDELSEKSSHHWKEKGNKYHHGERVANLISKLRPIILPNDNTHDDILTVSAWFHDLMNGVENHALLGAKKAIEVLKPYCSDYELDEIFSIIEVHDDRNANDNFSIYTKIHQDADLLDHFGTYEIWAHFLYCIAHDLPLDESAKYLEVERPLEGEQHFSLINFEISRKIFSEKSEFIKSFATRFCTEINGEVFNLDDILANTI